MLGILQDVMNKVRSDTILDMNLEKSRVKELVSMRLIKKKNKNQYIHLHRKTLKNSLVPNLFFLATAKQKSHKSICNNILFSIEPQLTYSVGNTSLFSWTQGWYNGRNSWKHTRFFNSSWSVFFWVFFLAICCHFIFFVLPVTLNHIIFYFQKAENEKKLLETRTEIMEMVCIHAVNTVCSDWILSDWSLSILFHRRQSKIVI